MAAVQRNNRPQTRSQTEKSPSLDTTSPIASDDNMPSSSSLRSSKPNPYLLLVYPAILAVGSLYAVISPSVWMSANAGLNPPAHSRANYFAGKRNFLNLYFVKMGWFWTTLAFAALNFTTRPPSSNKQKHYIQTATRWALVTVCWFLTTQWFFGPAVIDRSFTITGGRCEMPPMTKSTSTIDEIMEHGTSIPSSDFTSSIACKAAGGRWRGGHDISGHVFMLVLSSAFLLYELYSADHHSSLPHVSPRAAAALAHDMTEEEKSAVGGWESENLAQIRVWSRYFLYAVVALDFWMLMMTAIWFHTWLEKLSGLLLAGASIWAVYFLSDFVHAWKGVVGV